MKRFLIAAAVGILLTVVFAVLAGMGGGACHCNTPGHVLFPFESMLGDYAEGGALADWLFGLQFPAYVFAVAYARGFERKLAVAAVVLVAHVAAVAVVS